MRLMTDGWCVTSIGQRDERGRGSHLLGVRVRLECYVPAVVVRKLDADHLWAVVVLEQRLHFLQTQSQRFKTPDLTAFR